ncbi:glycosyltransferase family 2 protein [Phaeodactylibacter sp.]|uniref:glycosyltransferase family 2 protein n=1 Tax=Phaeodactylibacter sp. TaxID=1940289 RepID=UPI0025CE3003|nr:glycosyltransferase family 2 protein [Phaeodactylibacter sp.]MCI4648277.1 glycosyltransferase family 2 protein [Phaeodactylibacter sp.]MCI5091868.1 glycosyltransferase family 2 protein [Phaeodactylibacter sp.]
MSNPVRISGVIITLNEARHIRGCIESMLPVVDEVVVVDSFSTDETPAICQELGVRFLQHPFEGHIEQKNYAMRQAKYDYVLSLDADERVSDAMTEAILNVKQNWATDGYAFNRLNNYCGHWLRYAWYPDRKTRLWDRRQGQWGGTNPHDRVEVKGSVVTLKGDLLHYPYATVDEHFEQNRKFAVIAAQSKFAKGRRVNFLVDVVLGPWFKFIKLFVLKRGFLDGYYGFIFSALASYVNFMKYLKLWELNRHEER